MCWCKMWKKSGMGNYLFEIDWGSKFLTFCGFFKNPGFIVGEIEVNVIENED